MDFWKTIFGLIKRRAVGPPLAVLALAAAALVFFLMPVSYISTASMVLTTPAAGGTLPIDSTRPLGLTNPLLQFNDGLRVTAGILILSMNTPEVAAELGVVKNSSTKIIINDGRTNPNLLGISTNGPFVYVEVESRSAATAQDVVVKAKQRIRKELANRQDELRAPRSTFISVIDVVPSSTPEAQLSGRVTAAGGALFLVFLIGITIAYGLTQVRRGGRPVGLPLPSTGVDSAPEDEPPVIEFSDPGVRTARAARSSDRGAEVAGYSDPAEETGDLFMAVYPAEAQKPEEETFHDDSESVVVVVDDDEPLAHRDDQGADTIVFMRTGGRDDHRK